MLARYAVSLALVCGVALAADTPVPNARIRLERRQIDIAADGSAVAHTHSEVQVFSNAAIQALGQRPLRYSEAYQTLDVTSAYTLKADGTKVPVDPSAILTQQVPNLGLLSDLKQKVIVFPDVDINDTMVNETTITTKPLIPGQFTYMNVFPTGVGFDKTEMTFTAPRSLPIAFETHGPTLRKAVHGDKVTYTVTYSAPTPIDDTGQYVSQADRAPRFFASTFKSYDAFARTYAALALPKIAVTPKIQAKADEITAGVSDRRKQAQLLYDWVAGHVRYVAIEFGLGSIVPHDAESVLADAYGDCKDHATLYAALLKAKGIASNLALINGTNSYVLPSVPVLSAFDHVITYLPEFAMFADTTQRDLPFGLLPGPEYGKSVVLIGVDHDAVRQTPLLPDRPSTYVYAETLKLGDKGQLSSQSTLAASGLTGVYMKRLADLIQANGLEKSASNLLKTRNLPQGTGSFSFPQTSSGDVTVAASYQAQRDPDGGFAIPLGLDLENMAGDQFLGPIAIPGLRNADPVPCFGGHANEDYTIQLPAGAKVGELPPDAKIDTDNITYASHWSKDGSTVKLHREITARFDKPLCTGQVHTSVLEAIDKIRRDHQVQIALAP